MSLFALIFLALALAMDAASVGLATSIALQKIRVSQILRFALSFGLFQAGMPLLGWWSGRGFRQYIEAWDHWIALALLAAVGGKAIYDALRDDGELKNSNQDPTKGWSLLVLSVATSIDALAVGLSLAMIAQNIYAAAAVIGFVTALLTTLAMLFGAKLGAKLGQKFSRFTRVVGGLILIVIGIKIVLEHTQII